MRPSPALPIALAACGLLIGTLVSAQTPGGAAASSAGRPPGPKRSRITTLGSASQIPMGDDDDDIELTFGRWDDDDATTW